VSLVHTVLGDRSWARRLVAAVFACALLLPPAGSAGPCLAAGPEGNPALDPSTAPPLRSPIIVAPDMPEAPAAGKGRLSLQFFGNLQWCTFPDDRPVSPPEQVARPGARKEKDQVFTFGYTFTVAAIRRGAADGPIMLFESPIFRTASLRPAVKLGLSSKQETIGPGVGSSGVTGQPQPGKQPVGPGTLVPLWMGQNRCVKLPERLDFDVDAGVYDVYMAFDLMGKEGGWVHRSSAFLTDIAVAEARHTRVEGVIDLKGGRQRQVALLSASAPQATRTRGAGGP
jgi:hypothetical protein